MTDQSEGNRINRPIHVATHKTSNDSQIFYEKLSEYAVRTPKNQKIYFSQPKGIRERIDHQERRKELENNALEQDIKLKRNTLFILFLFLAAETILVFRIAWKQGSFLGDFYLDEVSFRTVMVATILQITAMLTIAVKHLFPEKN